MRMREFQARRAQLHATSLHVVEEQVDVDSAVVVDAVMALLRPAEFALYGLRLVEEGIWCKARCESCRGIEEAVLRAKALGLCLYHRRELQ